MFVINTKMPQFPKYFFSIGHDSDRKYMHLVPQAQSFSLPARVKTSDIGYLGLMDPNDVRGSLWHILNRVDVYNY